MSGEPSNLTRAAAVELMPTGSAPVDTQLEKVKRGVDDTRKCELIAGTRVDAVVISAGTTVDVYHGLARQIRGWFVCRNRAAGWPYETDSTDTLLSLTSVYDANCDLWVY